MFYDRAEAGEKLATALKKFQHQKDVIVLAMPRGGVVVGKEVSNKLQVPLDLVVTRKISAPGNSEFAIGAISQSGDPILNEEVIGSAGITPDYLDEEISKEKEELARRLSLYHQGKSPLNIKNKKVIIIDDGIATGLSIEAAIEHIKSQKAQEIIIAVPVASQSSIDKIKNKVNDLICLYVPETFFSVSQFYDQFDQVSDEEVIKLLNST